MKNMTKALSLLLQLPAVFGLPAALYTLLKTETLISPFGTGDVEKIKEGIAQSLSWVEVTVPISLAGIILASVLIYKKEKMRLWYRLALSFFCLCWILFSVLWYFSANDPEMPFVDGTYGSIHYGVVLPIAALSWSIFTLFYILSNRNKNRSNQAAHTTPAIAPR